MKAALGFGERGFPWSTGGVESGEREISVSADGKVGMGNVGCFGADGAERMSGVKIQCFIAQCSVELVMFMTRASVFSM